MCYGIFRKYAQVVPLKDKKDISFANAFQKILDKTGRKPNKIQFDKESEFYNNSIKKWLKDNDIEMYSIHNERKSVAAERFVRILKTKMCISINQMIQGISIIVRIIEQLK